MVDPFLSWNLIPLEGRAPSFMKTPFLKHQGSGLTHSLSISQTPVFVRTKPSLPASAGEHLLPLELPAPTHPQSHSTFPRTSLLLWAPEVSVSRTSSYSTLGQVSEASAPLHRVLPSARTSLAPALPTLALMAARAHRILRSHGCPVLSPVREDNSRLGLGSYVSKPPTLHVEHGTQWMFQEG